VFLGHRPPRLVRGVRQQEVQKASEAMEPAAAVTEKANEMKMQNSVSF